MADTTTIARPYAQALFDIAKRDGSLADWAKALNALAKVIVNAQASEFLSRPDLDDDARASFVSSVGSELGGGKVLASDRGKNFVALLIENKRISALADIAERFSSLKAEAENTIRVTLVAARAADRDVTDRIVSALEKRLGRTVELVQEIDETLLGGAVIRAEDMVIDGSVKTRLQKLADTLVS
jgi:F-type H+-transporting ATPase subunit delta